MQAQGQNMNPYVVRFLIANVVLTAAFGVFAEMMKLQAASGLAVAATIGAGMYAASAFTKHHSREPSSAEVGGFAWRALLATWVVSLVLFIVFLMIFSSAAEVRALFGYSRVGLMSALMAGVVIFVSTVYYVGIRWSFKWYARLAVKRG